MPKKETKRVPIQHTQTMPDTLRTQRTLQELKDSATTRKKKKHLKRKKCYTTVSLL